MTQRSQRSRSLLDLDGPAAPDAIDFPHERQICGRGPNSSASLVQSIAGHDLWAVKTI
jgi:hypothetical protein